MFYGEGSTKKVFESGDFSLEKLKEKYNQQAQDLRMEIGIENEELKVLEGMFFAIKKNTTEKKD